MPPRAALPQAAAPSTKTKSASALATRISLAAWYALGEMPERTIELGSYHAMLGCVVAGMGAALVPKSVLGTFPESKRLRVHPLPRGQRRRRTLSIWRKGASSPKVEALAHILNQEKAGGRDRLASRSKRVR